MCADVAYVPIGLEDVMGDYRPAFGHRPGWGLVTGGEDGVKMFREVLAEREKYRMMNQHQ